MGAVLPDAQHDRLRRADLRGVGGRGHGPARRCPRSARVRASAGLRRPDGLVRCRLLIRQRGTMSASVRRHVVVVGSGPTGATYARRLLEGTTDAVVTVIEAGPVLTDPAGMNVRNVADPGQQLAAKLASQGPAADAAGMAGIPVGTVVEGTVTARQGTHLIGRAADGSDGMPAAAGS